MKCVVHYHPEAGAFQMVKYLVGVHSFFLIFFLNTKPIHLYIKKY